MFFLKTNVDDDEEFYSRMSHKKISKYQKHEESIEKSLRKSRKTMMQRNDDSFIGNNHSQQVDQDIYIISKTTIQSATSLTQPEQSETNATTDSETDAYDSAFADEFYGSGDDRSSVLFNDTILTWSTLTTCELDQSFDLLSLDSGLSSSFSVSIDTLSPPKAKIATVVAPNMLYFDSMLRNALSSKSSSDFDLFSSPVEFVSSVSAMLKNAFLSLSKSSIKRIFHSVLSRFLTRKSFLEFNQAVDKINIPQTLFLSKISLFKSINRVSLSEYKTNLIYRFYAFYSFNFC